MALPYTHRWRNDGVGQPTKIGHPSLLRSALPCIKRSDSSRWRWPTPPKVVGATGHPPCPKSVYVPTEVCMFLRFKHFFRTNDNWNVPKRWNVPKACLSLGAFRNPAEATARAQRDATIASASTVLVRMLGQHRPERQYSQKFRPPAEKILGRKTLTCAAVFWCVGPTHTRPLREDVHGGHAGWLHAAFHACQFSDFLRHADTHLIWHNAMYCSS